MIKATRGVGTMSDAGEAYGARARSLALITGLLGEPGASIIAAGSVEMKHTSHSVVRGYRLGPPARDRAVRSRSLLRL
jgi:hypothetical protein